MILLGVIGGWQIVLSLIIIVFIITGIYLIGYRSGKKSGYLKRVKETDKNEDNK